MRLLSPLGRAPTKRFLFLMVPRRRECAKSVIESKSDLNMVKSWALTLWSVSGLEMPMLDRNFSTDGRTVEKAAVRWDSVLVIVLPAWPI